MQHAFDFSFPYRKGRQNEHSPFLEVATDSLSGALPKVKLHTRGGASDLLPGSAARGAADLPGSPRQGGQQGLGQCTSLLGCLHYLWVTVTQSSIDAVQAMGGQGREKLLISCVESAPFLCLLQEWGAEGPEVRS